MAVGEKSSGHRAVFQLAQQAAQARLVGDGGTTFGIILLQDRDAAIAPAQNVVSQSVTSFVVRGRRFVNREHLARRIGAEGLRVKGGGKNAYGARGIRIRTVARRGAQMGLAREGGAEMGETVPRRHARRRWANAQNGSGLCSSAQKKATHEEEPRSHRAGGQRPHLGFRQVQPIQARTRRGSVRRRSCRLSEATHAFCGISSLNHRRKELEGRNCQNQKGCSPVSGEGTVSDKAHSAFLRKSDCKAPFTYSGWRIGMPPASNSCLH